MIDTQKLEGGIVEMKVETPWHLSLRIINLFVYMRLLLDSCYNFDEW
jgi:hypothetical protein